MKSKQRLTHIITLILVICFVATMFSACTVKQSGDTKGDTKDEEKTTEAGVEIDDGSKTYIYSMNIHNAQNEWLNCEVLKGWREKFNIEFNFLPITWNDWQQKVMIWMSSGDVPDVTYWDMKLSMANDYEKWVRAGLIKEIKDIDKYPNVKKHMDAMRIDDALMVDGKKYVWPCSKDTTLVGDISCRGFIYRKDWARKLGLVKEDDIYTWEEMVEIAQQCVEKDPGGVGKNNIAGLACTTWAWPSSLGIEQFTAGVIGSGGYTKKDGKWEWNARAPEYLEAIKETKRLYDEGIIWVDNPLCKGDEPSQKFTAGEIAVYYDNIFAYNLHDKRTKMTENIPGLKSEDIAYMKVKTPYGKFAAIRDTEFWCVSLFSAKMPDAKFDRLMKAWDWMLTDEGYFTRQIGIRGIDWEFDGDSVKYLWPYNEETKRYERPKDNPRFIGSVCYHPIGITEGFGFLDPNIKSTNSGKDAYDYCKWCEENATLIPPNYELSTFKAPNKDKYGSFGSDMRDTIIQIIISSTDPDKDWNDFLKSKEDKINLVIDELNAGLK